MQEKNDWVDVRLTEFGAQYAAGAPLRVQEGNGGQGFMFKPGEPQRVTRAFDWERVLKPWHVNGHALFQLVQPATAEQAAEELRELGIDATAEPGGIMVNTPEVALD